MPKIPTFQSESTITSQGPSVTSNLQIPLSQTVGAALQPVSDFVKQEYIKERKLEENNNIGLTGPINNNSSILTQAFVSRRHMLIFGWFFPEEIKNWYCDDWYNIIY